jgi:hypothetical protein
MGEREPNCIFWTAVESIGPRDFCFASVEIEEEVGSGSEPMRFPAPGTNSGDRSRPTGRVMSAATRAERFSRRSRQPPQLGGEPLLHVAEGSGGLIERGHQGDEAVGHAGVQVEFDRHAAVAYSVSSSLSPSSAPTPIHAGGSPESTAARAAAA